VEISCKKDQKARCLRRGPFSQEEYTTKSVFARAGARRTRTPLQHVFFEKLSKALDQPAAAADHVQPAFMLMLFEDVVQFVLEFGHGKDLRFKLTYWPLRGRQAAVYKLTTSGRDQKSEIVMSGIRKINDAKPAGSAC